MSYLLLGGFATDFLQKGTRCTLVIEDRVAFAGNHPVHEFRSFRNTTRTMNKLASAHRCNLSPRRGFIQLLGGPFQCCSHSGQRKVNFPQSGIRQCAPLLLIASERRIRVREDLVSPWAGETRPFLRRFHKRIQVCMAFESLILHALRKRRERPVAMPRCLRVIVQSAQPQQQILTKRALHVIHEWPASQCVQQRHIISVAEYDPEFLEPKQSAQ